LVCLAVESGSLLEVVLTVEPIYSEAVIFSSLLTLLSIGLTLTYLTTKVPNFAHGTLATIGTYISLTAATVWKGNLYYFLGLAFVMSGATALVQYVLALRPLMRKGASIVGLMVTTLAIDIILLAVLNIYADYLSRQFKVLSRYFYLRPYDFSIAGQRGILIVAPTLTVVTVTFLYVVLTRTKFGVAMRAAIMNPSLASVVGVNVNLIYSLSWFIAGGLAGLAGGLLPMHLVSNPDIGVTLIASIFAASVVGGLLNIYGAVLGGFLIGLAEVLGTSYLASWAGTWVIPYRPMIPLVAIAVTLLIAPKGLLGVDWLNLMKVVRGGSRRLHREISRDSSSHDKRHHKDLGCTSSYFLASSFPDGPTIFSSFLEPSVDVGFSGTMPSGLYICTNTSATPRSRKSSHTTEKGTNWVSRSL